MTGISFQPHSMIQSSPGLPGIPARDCDSPQSDSRWASCRYLTCSVLPVRFACNLSCSFCFSKSSISSLAADRIDWRKVPLDRYFEYARDRGATRLVITGGGEPLLRPEETIYLLQYGRRYFDEAACFTNGAFLTRQLSRRMSDAGLSYLCYSRHAADDLNCQKLMGLTSPSLSHFFEMADRLTIRATCVMAQGFVDSTEEVWRYIQTLSTFGVRQFTFKHTYVAYGNSLFGLSKENQWAAAHRVSFDPFGNMGQVISSLPWGPKIRRIGQYQCCFYHEPSPDWELEHQLCRSINLLSDGTAYASLEDQSSRLFQLIH